jgi:hypothetical protein
MKIIRDSADIARDSILRTIKFTPSLKIVFIDSRFSEPDP